MGSIVCHGEATPNSIPCSPHQSSAWNVKGYIGHHIWLFEHLTVKLAISWTYMSYHPFNQGRYCIQRELIFGKDMIYPEAKDMRLSSLGGTSLCCNLFHFLTCYGYHLGMVLLETIINVKKATWHFRWRTNRFAPMLSTPQSIHGSPTFKNTRRISTWNFIQHWDHSPPELNCKEARIHVSRLESLAYSKCKRKVQSQRGNDTLELETNGIDRDPSETVTERIIQSDGQLFVISTGCIAYQFIYVNGIYPVW